MALFKNTSLKTKQTHTIPSIRLTDTRSKPIYDSMLTGNFKSNIK